MKITSLIGSLMILLGFAQLAHAQSDGDSLFNVWLDTDRADSTRVEAFKTYIRNEFLYSQTDSAIVLAERMVSFSQEVHYPRGEAIGLRILGVTSRIKGDYARAIDFYQQSLHIAEQSGALKDIALALNNIGNIHYDQDNFPAALEYYQRSLKINEDIQDQGGIALTLNNIGNIYFDQGDLPRALQCYQRSLNIRHKTEDKAGVAASTSTIGSVYSNQGDYLMALEYFQRSLKLNEESGDLSGVADNLNNIGILYYFQREYTEALRYYERSLRIAEDLGALREMADVLNNIGINYKTQGDYTTALKHFHRSLKIREELGDQGGIANSQSNIGSVYEKQGRYSLALEFCKRGLELAEGVGLLIEQRGSCQCIYDTYKSMGKGNEAIIYLEKMNAIDDSLNAKETVRKLQQMEFAKKTLSDSIANAEEIDVIETEHQAEVRKKNKIRNLLAVSGLVLFLVSGVFFTRWRYVKKSRAVLQVEKTRSDNLLLNILPEEIAQELMEKGRAEARDFDMVSILFTDFKSFTETSATLSAAELVEEINHCFEAFDTIVEKYGIEKIKTIGDAYMAAGGLPVPGQDSVKCTVQAAFEMQEFIAKRKLENVALGKPAFEMRIGINTGPVVAGIVGVKKFQYDIWGDTVNTASRMESSGETGKVNISQSTYDLLKEDADLEFEYRGKLKAKGKGEIDMYFVRLKQHIKP